MAHHDCNWNRSKSRKKIPIFAHNATGYDMHYCYQAIAQLKECGEERIKYISVLPTNSQKFKSMSLNSYVFKDSLAFLNFSLDALVADYKLRNGSFDILRRSILCEANGVLNEKKLNVCMIGKLNFPYEKCVSAKQMKSVTKFPPKKDFYSSLREEHISNESYKNSKKFWKEFDVQNLLDFAKYYCHLDVTLLACVYLDYRQWMFDNSGKINFQQNIDKFFIFKINRIGLHEVRRHARISIRYVFKNHTI